MRSEPFRVAFVPGVTPDKWARIWAERVPDVPLDLRPVPETDQASVLYDGLADMCFLRLPADRDRLHVIPLYEEQTVVVAPKGHFVEAADEVSVHDLADEHLLQDPDAVPEWRAVSSGVREGTRVEVPGLSLRQAFETVGAGVGIVIVPLSVARLFQRKDVVHRPVVDVATTWVGLAWLREPAGQEPDPLGDTFIGIVRGRRATSTRGTPRAAPKQGGEDGADSTRARRPEKPARKTGARRPSHGRGAPVRGRRGRRR